MRVVITGADGFIGRNLRVRLGELGGHEVLPITKATTAAQLAAALAEAEFVFHFAGVNRPRSDDEFIAGNVVFTEKLCTILANLRRPVPVAYTSSSRAVLDNPYGKSKRAAEKVLQRYGDQTGACVHLFRLPNVFGKWCRPDYNSAVATFCHNIARGLPIRIDDSNAEVTLVHIDDVVATMVDLLSEISPPSATFASVEPEYRITVGALAQQIRAFQNCRTTLVSERVGEGLTRALYATYISYLPVEQFVYDIPSYVDARGAFSEMLKTKDSGQFSFFTAHPGVTRGGHYHHSKTEKFLVLQGEALFRFRNLLTGELHELSTSGSKPQIVETIPGWVHDITNKGDREMIVMLWANEIFDRTRPDTVQAQV